MIVYTVEALTPPGFLDADEADAPSSQAKDLAHDECVVVGYEELIDEVIAELRAVDMTALLVRAGVVHLYVLGECLAEVLRLAAHHGEEPPARRRGEIENLPDRVQRDAVQFELVTQLHQVAQISRESVKLPDDDVSNVGRLDRRQQ